MRRREFITLVGCTAGRSSDGQSTICDLHGVCTMLASDPWLHIISVTFVWKLLPELELCGFFIMGACDEQLHFFMILARG